MRKLNKRETFTQFLAAAKMLQWRELSSTFFLSAARAHTRNVHALLPAVRGASDIKFISNYKPRVRYGKLRNAKLDLDRIHL